MAPARQAQGSSLNLLPLSLEGEMGSWVPEDSRPGPVSFSTALLLRVGVQRREQGAAAAARPLSLAGLRMGRNLGACWMRVGQSRHGGEGWRTAHPFWSRRLCSEALALRALAPPKAKGVKAWQCLLSHALTLGPSPQAWLPRWGAGGGASGQVPAVLWRTPWSPRVAGLFRQPASHTSQQEGEKQSNNKKKVLLGEP